MESKKLHLGCGQRYLDGYINIDYPPSEHTVQKKSVADLYADIRDLHYEKDSIEEVRLHHVFEHFTRPVACALLTEWSQWIYVGGYLDIEVPDFDRTAKNILSHFSSEKARMVGLRHLFGSEEASWAIHYAAYSGKDLEKLIAMFGFKTEKTTHTKWQDTFNVEVIAQKKFNVPMEILKEKVSNYLRLFCLDDTENEMHRVWIEIYESQLKRSGNYK